MDEAVEQPIQLLSIYCAWNHSAFPRRTTSGASSVMVSKLYLLALAAINIKLGCSTHLFPKCFGNLVAVV